MNARWPLAGLIIALTVSSGLVLGQSDACPQSIGLTSGFEEHDYALDSWLWEGTAFLNLSSVEFRDLRWFVYLVKTAILPADFRDRIIDFRVEGPPTASAEQPARFTFAVTLPSTLSGQHAAGLAWEGTYRWKCPDGTSSGWAEWNTVRTAPTSTILAIQVERSAPFAEGFAIALGVAFAARVARFRPTRE